MRTQPLKIMVAVGARPNYMKAAPLIRALTDPSSAVETGRPPIELLTCPPESRCSLRVRILVQLSDWIGLERGQ
ncbi:MAG: hypothetical protein QF593_11965 [Nitrospinota bacterium]|nr:hypothetical protein [Nitrospinota bacterium]